MGSLYNYQKQSIAQLLSGKHFVIAGTGLGKGAIAMVYAATRCEETGKSKVLVVTTASKSHMKPNDYELDLARWCPSSPLLKSLSSSLSVISWAKLSAWVQANWGSLEEYVFVFDECLPADTKVKTDTGEKEIADIKAGDRVLSYNHDTDVTEYKTVYRLIKKPAPEKMVCLHLNNGTTIISTSNHPHYTQDGYKEAEDIKNGDTLYELHYMWKTNVLGTNVTETKVQLSENGESILLQGVQAERGVQVRQCVSSADESGKMGRNTVLQYVPQADRRENDTGKKVPGVHSKEKDILLRSMHEKGTVIGSAESNGDEKENRMATDLDSPSRVARGERENQRTTEIALGETLRDEQRMGDGTTDITREERTELPDLLQARYRERLLQDRDRVRWGEPQFGENSSEGQEKREEISGVRVESVEVLELGDIKQHQLYRDPDNVYCIDVEDNHNFFANGVLTHNCAAVKAGVSSQRGRAFLKIAKRNSDWAGFTATPGESWLHFYPYFQACNLVRNKTSFLNEYANVQTYKGYPEIVGWRNEKRLRDMWAAISYAPDTSKALAELPKETHRVIDFSTPKSYSNVLKTRQTADGEFLDTTMGLCHHLRQLCFTKDKEQWVKDFIENLGERVIIFYSYIAEGDKLEEIAKKVTSGKVWRIDGKHHDIPTEETCGERDVVLCQWQSGSEGLNAQYVNYFVSTTPNYSYSTSLQARGRIQRIGAKCPKFYYYLKCPSTIEGDIYKTLHNKKDFATNAWAISKGVSND